MFNLPDVLSTIATVVLVLTSLATAVVLYKHWASGKGVPLSGVAAYLVTLYLWMVFVRMDPIWLLIVPALHSLQYLAIVWRFELNRQGSRDDAFDRVDAGWARAFLRRKQLQRFFWFSTVGFVLGLLGFWVVPVAFEVAIPLSPDGVRVFLFAFWVFINVHHYFIDNVIWRSENPEVKQYLFAEPRSAPPAAASAKLAA
jgi:hypothetical protein